MNLVHLSLHSPLPGPSATTVINMFTQELVFNLSVTELGVKCRVAEEDNGAIVVADEGGGSGLMLMKSGEKPMQPDEFLRGLTCGNIFSLTHGESDK